MKLHTDTFMSSKFDNDKSTFFLDNTDKKSFCFRIYQVEYTTTLAFTPFEQVLD